MMMISSTWIWTQFVLGLQWRRAWKIPGQLHQQLCQAKVICNQTVQSRISHSHFAKYISHGSRFQLSPFIVTSNLYCVTINHVCIDIKVVLQMIFSTAHTATVWSCCCMVVVEMTVGWYCQYQAQHQRHLSAVYHKVMLQFLCWFAPDRRWLAPAYTPVVVLTSSVLSGG